MSRIAIGAIAAASIVLQACSVHPSPEDVVFSSGRDIAKLTRCQFIGGLKEFTIWLARKYSEADRQAHKRTVLYDGMDGDQFAAWLASPDDDNFPRMKWERFEGKPGKGIKAYRSTIIAYDYSIEAVEANKVGIDLTLLRTFTKGSNGLGVTVGNDRSRSIKDHWNEFDTFESLLKRPHSYCEGTAKVANLVFPAAGLTRLNEMPRRFIGQNEWDNLSSKDDLALASTDVTLTFKTKSSAVVKPVFKLPGQVGDTIATEIAPTLDNAREDNHTILIYVKQSAGKAIPAIAYDGRAVAPGFVESGRRTFEREFDRMRQRNTDDAIGKIGDAASRFLN